MNGHRVNPKFLSYEKRACTPATSATRNLRLAAFIHATTTSPAINLLRDVEHGTNSEATSPRSLPNYPSESRFVPTHPISCPPSPSKRSTLRFSFFRSAWLPYILNCRRKQKKSLLLSPNTVPYTPSRTVHEAMLCCGVDGS